MNLEPGRVQRTILEAWQVGRWLRPPSPCTLEPARCARGGRFDGLPMLAAWPASAMTRKVYVALERCEMLLEDIDPTIQLKAAHGVFQGASAYAKVLEVGELEARLQALEQAQGVART